MVIGQIALNSKNTGIVRKRAEKSLSKLTYARGAHFQLQQQFVFGFQRHFFAPRCGRGDARAQRMKKRLNLHMPSMAVGIFLE